MAHYKHRTEAEEKAWETSFRCRDVVDTTNASERHWRWVFRARAIRVSKASLERGESAVAWEPPVDGPATAVSNGQVEAVIRRYENELLRFFQGQVPASAQQEDAADLVQESALRLLRYRDVTSTHSLRMLLFRIGRNLLKDYWRHQRRHSIEESSDLTDLIVESDAPSQERIVDGQRRLRQLEAALAALPPKCRTVFALSRISGMSNHQVAEHLGISVKAVEKHLTRALRQCRSQVGDFDP